MAHWRRGWRRRHSAGGGSSPEVRETRATVDGFGRLKDLEEPGREGGGLILMVCGADWLPVAADDVRRRHNCHGEVGERDKAGKKGKRRFSVLLTFPRTRQQSLGAAEAADT